MSETGEYLKLTDVGPARALRFDWADRLNILTGDNGAGKTFALDVLWWVLTRTWGGRPALPFAVSDAKPGIEFALRGSTGVRQTASIEYNYGTQAWVFPRGRPCNPGLVLYLRANSGLSVWDPARNLVGGDPAGSEVISYVISGAQAYHFGPDDTWGGLRRQDRVLCSGLIHDWVDWQSRKPTLFQALGEVLKLLSPSLGEGLVPADPIQTDPDDAREIPALRLPYGVVPVTHASAGMRRILALAYMLVWACEENRRASELRRREPAHRLVLLVDEVEAHLHPLWQRRIMPALLKAVSHVAPGVDVQVVASTHAPLVLASLEPHFREDADAIFDLDIADGGVTCRRREWQPMGDVSAWLTSDIFNLAAARSEEAERAIEQAKEALAHPDLAVERMREIHHGLQDVLGALDPFWPRWVAYAECKGIEL